MVASALLGGLVYAYTGAWRSFRPTSTDWFPSEDPLTHWLGWAFFRHAPLMQWPLGNNPLYGAGLGETIVFSDSIPLLALVFRPLTGLLPDHFQYIGMWILACYLLQGVFAYLLIKILTDLRLVAIVGSLLFTMAPIAVTRLSGHYALGGQWIIIAALYLYFRRQEARFGWPLLLAIAALVHAYLLAMTVPIWFADIAYRWYAGRIDRKRSAIRIAIGLATIFLVAAAAGYLSVSQSVASGGYGLYSMNLNSFFNPVSPFPDGEDFSRFLPVLPVLYMQQEGAAYLGLGVMTAVAGGLLALFFRPSIGVVSSRGVIVSLTIVALLIYAISDQVTAGADVVLSYPIPPIAARLASVFRASGRFAWPMVYLLTAGAIFWIVRPLGARSAALAVSGLVLIQAIDIGPTLSRLENKYRGMPSKVTLADPLWKAIAASGTDDIRFVRPLNKPAGWEKLAVFAARHDMAINVGYFARVDAQKLEDEQLRMAQTIWSGVYDDASVYVFNDERLWNSARYSAPASAGFFLADGYRVMVPGLGEGCGGCTKLARPIGPQPPFFDGIRSDWAFHGWNQLEGNHRWSQGDRGEIRVFTHHRDRDQCLTVRAYTLGEQSIGIAVDGIVTDGTTVAGDVLLNVPLGTEAGRRIVTLTFSNPRSPDPTDQRLLALDLLGLSIGNCHDGGT